MREICARGFFRKDFHLLVNFFVTSLRKFSFMESRATFSCFYHSPVSMIRYRNTIHKENYVNPWKYFLSRIVIGNATIWHWAGESVKCICEKMLWKKLLIRDRVEERKTNTKLGKHFLGFVRLPASLLFSRTSLFIYEYSFPHCLSIKSDRSDWTYTTQYFIKLTSLRIEQISCKRKPFCVLTWEYFCR